MQIIKIESTEIDRQLFDVYQELRQRFPHDDPLELRAVGDEGWLLLLNSYGVNMRTGPGIEPSQIHSFRCQQSPDGPVWRVITNSLKTQREKHLPLLLSMCQQATDEDRWYNVRSGDELPPELRSENY